MASALEEQGAGIIGMIRAQEEVIAQANLVLDQLRANKVQLRERASSARANAQLVRSALLPAKEEEGDPAGSSVSNSVGL